MVNKKTLGMIGMAMINVAAIQSLGDLPVMATVGIQSIFFFLLAALIFFIPCSLAVAELGSTWPSSGGIYTWTEKAFGKRLGFVACWLYWIKNIVGFPVTLSFTAATLSFVFFPNIATNKYYLIGIMLIIYWFCTYINLFGLKTSSIITTVGVIIGTILPVLLIIVLSLIWIMSGHQVQILHNPAHAIPNIVGRNNMALLLGTIFGLSGMEMSAAHSQELKKPKKNYPFAILLSGFVVLLISILGTISIAVVIPYNKISYVTGTMQAFKTFLVYFHLSWFVPIIAFLIIIGTITNMGAWIIGPSKKLLKSANDGLLPDIFTKTNKHGLPIAILVSQGIIISIIAFTFILMPTINSSYWVLMDLTVIIYIVIYSFMFISVLVLRYKEPNTERAYKIPGGNLGIMLVVGIGMLGCIVEFIIGLIPPDNLHLQSSTSYEILLTVIMLILILIPLVLYDLNRFYKKSRNNK